MDKKQNNATAHKVGKQEGVKAEKSIKAQSATSGCSISGKSTSKSGSRDTKKGCK